MPTRLDLLDTRGWMWGRPRLDPPPPAVAEGPRHVVTFLDRTKRGWKAGRRVHLDCLPLLWTQMERGEAGLVRRTWLRADGDAGVVYREQAPAAFVPTAYKPGGDMKKGKRLPAASREFEEEWAE